MDVGFLYICGILVLFKDHEQKRIALCYVCAALVPKVSAVRGVALRTAPVVTIRPVAQRMEVVAMAKRRNAKKEKRERNKEAARKYSRKVSCGCLLRWS